MNRFFNYYNLLCSGENTHNASNYDPYIVAIKEMLVNELRKIVFYIEKLKSLNVDMSNYTDKVIDFISVLIINLDFKKESFFTIINDLYNNKKILENMYILACEKNSVEYDLLKEDDDFSSNDKILKVLNRYENNMKDKQDIFDKKKKTLYEIILALLFNACNFLIELKNLNVDFPEAKSNVLKILNESNSSFLDENELISLINQFSKCNYSISKLLYEKIDEYFGPVIKANVPISTKKGKAILISGSSLLELEKLLNAVKGLDINVYTHNELVNAFQYTKLQSFSNLAGSFKKSGNNLFVDFASFPGPIYVSKNSVLKTDVIRGQIYTSAKYPPYGIGKIENGDFTPLIKYALETSGFEKDDEVNTINIGYVKEDIEKEIESIKEKYNKNEIKRIIIIGLIDGFNTNDEYIKSFLKSADESDFIISFSYNSDRKNFLKINSFFDFAVFYKIIEDFFENLDGISNRFAVFMPDCSRMTISHIFNLMYLGVENIFLGPCCPNIISPTLMEGLTEIFNINIISEPSADIEKIN